ncbi:hypothetical protein BsWGS_14464 [Bradybaena similaris]
MNTLQLVCLAAIFIGAAAVLAADDKTEPTVTSRQPPATTQDPAAVKDTSHNGTTTEWTTDNLTDELTIAAYTTQSADVKNVNSILESLKDLHCNGTDGKPCDFEYPKNSDKKTLCSALDAAKDCLNQCVKTDIKDTIDAVRKSQNCDGCAFVQASMMMLLLATLLHFLV